MARARTGPGHLPYYEDPLPPYNLSYLGLKYNSRPADPVGSDTPNMWSPVFTYDLGGRDQVSVGNTCIHLEGPPPIPVTGRAVLFTGWTHEIAGGDDWLHVRITDDNP